jgi:hypothetical protein
MENQNTALFLPKDLLKKAKALAASRHMSLSELMRQLLEEKIMKANGYRAAKKRQLKLMCKGLDLGTRGKIVFPREDLHGGRLIDGVIIPYESNQMQVPLKDTVKFAGDIVSPVAKEGRKASK